MDLAGPISRRHRATLIPPAPHLLLSFLTTTQKNPNLKLTKQIKKGPSGPTCHRVQRPPQSISNTSRLKICEKKPKIETKQKGWRKSLPPLRGDGGGDDDGELGYRGTDVSPSDRRRRRLVPRLRHPRGPPGRCLRRFPVGRIRLLVQSKVSPALPAAQLFWPRDSLSPIDLIDAISCIGFYGYDCRGFVDLGNPAARWLDL